MCSFLKDLIRLDPQRHSELSIRWLLSCVRVRDVSRPRHLGNFQPMMNLWLATSYSMLVFAYL